MLLHWLPQSGLFWKQRATRECDLYLFYNPVLQLIEDSLDWGPDPVTELADTHIQLSIRVTSYITSLAAAFCLRALFWLIHNNFWPVLRLKKIPSFVSCMYWGHINIPWKTFGRHLGVQGCWQSKTGTRHSLGIVSCCPICQSNQRNIFFLIPLSLHWLFLEPLHLCMLDVRAALQ